MACSFAVFRITVLISVLFPSLISYCRAEKGILFKKGDLWGRKKTTAVIGKGGVGWFSDAGSTAARSCDSKDTENWFYLNSIKTDAERVFVEVEYKVTETYCNESDCGLFLREHQGAADPGDQAFKIGDFSTETITITATERKKVTIHYDMGSEKSSSKYLTLAIQAKGICVWVYNISIYYYYCPRNISKSVVLERTPAPSVGSKPVSGYCSESLNDRKKSIVTECDEKGNWKNFNPQPNLCHCSAGYEFNNDSGHCTPCKKDHFKKRIGEDEPCKLCPKNTVSELKIGSASCRCVTNYYRNSDVEECRQIPSQPEDLNYTTSSPHNGWIMLVWNRPHGKFGKIYYKIKCKRGRKPCNNISVGKEGVNLTRRHLNITGLQSGRKYVFTVTAFNDVSGKAGEQNSKSAVIDVELPVSAPISVTTMNPPGIPKDPEEKKSTVRTKGHSSSTRTTTSVATGDIQTSLGNGGGSKQAVNDKQSMALDPATIGGAIGGLLLIMALVAIFLYRRRHMKKERLQEEMPMLEKSYIDPAKYGNPEKAVRVFAKEIDRRQLKLEGVIGEGEFARVHKGLLCRPNEPPITVALKVLKPGSTAKNREDFLTEAAVMAQFKDMNIVALEGVVTISHPVMIITEFMHNGALSTFLGSNKNRFGETELLTMARGIASGMKYLARMRFVHRDLAARNVLVNENLVCKVADFGLTRELEESCQGEYVTQGGKIPIRWTAPEAYKHRRFTTASDVWSFGIVLWEIMSYAERPYGHWDNYMVMDQVNANYRLTPPTNCPKIVHQLMMECWKADRTQRPAFSDIVEMLERWIRNPYLLKDYEYVTEKTRMADRKSCVAKSIREYLETIKMERYIDNFIDFGYTELYQIQHLNDDDLVGIGVPLVGHRNKIMKSLSLRSQRELPTVV